MSVSIRFSDSELEAVKDYAKAYGMTLSECIRKAVLELVEDEYDLEAYKEAKAEFEKDPVTYTLDEVMQHLGMKD